MVESYTPKPIAERKSQKLNFGNFISDQFIPKYAGLAIGLVGGWVVGGFIGKSSGSKIGAQYGRQLGSAVGGIVLGFLNWRKNAASEMDSAEVADRLRDVVPMAMTNDEVKREISYTRDLLEYEQRQNNTLKGILEAGPKSHTQHAAAPDEALEMAR